MMNIVFPVGRIVSGSVTKLFQEKDDDGKLKVKVDGAPEMRCYFGFAIAKKGEAHWNQTPWGAQVWAAGKEAFPAQHAWPSFAWKISDGDSVVPNKGGTIYANNPNFKGHWIIWFRNFNLPTLCTADGAHSISEDAIRTGYFVKVKADVASNRSDKSPGVYMNHQAVALVAVGDEIVSEVDTSDFATVADSLPPGARPLPAASEGFAPPPAAPVAPPPAAPVAPPPAAPVAPPPAAPVAPPPAPPNPAFLEPARTMLPAAGGVPYESWIANGWTDELLIQHGKMAR